ncbi:MAG: cobalamin [Fibrobacterota bacterium]|jgi:sirohydrochlorin cobaltochelatase
MNAVVVLGHGSRAPGASEAMERIARVLRGRRPERIEVAHMELADPSLAVVLQRLHGDGFRHVVVVPYFLHHGIHLREDIPGILDAVRARCPELEIVTAPHLGFDDALVDVVEKRMEQAAAIGGR